MRLTKILLGFPNRLLAIVLLFVFFIWEVTLASMKVLWWIYSKPKALQSEFFHLPLHVKTDWQRILIAHFITLTPGTLSVDIEGNSILVHLLERSEKASTIHLIHHRIEPLVKKIWGQK